MCDTKRMGVCNSPKNKIKNDQQWFSTGTFFYKIMESFVKILHHESSTTVHSYRFQSIYNKLFVDKSFALEIFYVSNFLNDRRFEWNFDGKIFTIFGGLKYNSESALPDDLNTIISLFLERTFILNVVLFCLYFFIGLSFIVWRGLLLQKHFILLF